MKSETDNVAKTVLSVLALVIALIPFWLWLGMRALVDPAGFWQNLLVVGLGAYFLGFIQILLIIVFFVALVGIWDIY